MDVYNTITNTKFALYYLCIKLQKLLCCEGVSNIVSMGETVNLIHLTAVINQFWESWKHYCGIFLLLFDQMGMQKYIWCSLPFTAIQV